MKFKPVKWKSDNAYVGPIKIGSIWHNIIDGRATGLYYIAGCTLPGINGKLGKYATAQEAMTALENEFNKFIQSITE